MYLTLLYEMSKFEMGFIHYKLQVELSVKLLAKGILSVDWLDAFSDVIILSMPS